MVTGDGEKYVDGAQGWTKQDFGELIVDQAFNGLHFVNAVIDYF